jgi:hypothetical protein
VFGGDVIGKLQICSLCESPERNAIDKMIADGATAALVLLYMQSKGLEPVHRNTVSHHKVKHVRAVVVQRVQRTVQTARRLGERPPPGISRDLAVVVRDDVLDRMEDGDIRPTIAEGLRAQEMIDRRMEKQGDREVIISYIESVTGIYYPPTPIEDSWVTKNVTPPEIEEGEWVEPTE